VTLTFDLLTSKLMRNVTRVMEYPPANFGDTTTIRFSIYGPLGQHGSDRSRDLVTLTSEVMAPAADAGRRPPSVYQVRRPRHSEDMAHGVCQH